MKKILSLLMLLTVAIPSLMATDFKKVTSVDELVPGANYIIAGTHSSGTYVLTDGATSLETNATLSGKLTTVTDDVITAPDEAAIFTLEQSGEYYKLKYNGSKVVDASLMQDTELNEDGTIKSTEKKEKGFFLII